MLRLTLDSHRCLAFTDRDDIGMWIRLYSLSAVSCKGFTAIHKSQVVISWKEEDEP